MEALGAVRRRFERRPCPYTNDGTVRPLRNSAEVAERLANQYRFNGDSQKLADGAVMVCAHYHHAVGEILKTVDEPRLFVATPANVQAVKRTLDLFLTALEKFDGLGLNRFSDESLTAIHIPAISQTLDLVLSALRTFGIGANPVQIDAGIGKRMPARPKIHATRPLPAILASALPDLFGGLRWLGAVPREAHACVPDIPATTLNIREALTEPSNGPRSSHDLTIIPLGCLADALDDAVESLALVRTHLTDAQKRRRFTELEFRLLDVWRPVQVRAYHDAKRYRADRLQDYAKLESGADPALREEGRLLAQSFDEQFSQYRINDLRNRMKAHFVCDEGELASTFDRFFASAHVRDESFLNFYGGEQFQPDGDGSVPARRPLAFAIDTVPENTGEWQQIHRTQAQVDAFPMAETLAPPINKARFAIMESIARLIHIDAAILPPGTIFPHTKETLLDALCAMHEELEALPIQKVDDSFFSTKRLPNPATPTLTLFAHELPASSEVVEPSNPSPVHSANRLAALAHSDTFPYARRVSGLVHNATHDYDARAYALVSLAAFQKTLGAAPSDCNIEVTLAVLGHMTNHANLRTAKTHLDQADVYINALKLANNTTLRGETRALLTELLLLNARKVAALDVPAPAFRGAATAYRKLIDANDVAPATKRHLTLVALRTFADQGRAEIFDDRDAAALMEDGHDEMHRDFDGRMIFSDDITSDNTRALSPFSQHRFALEAAPPHLRERALFNEAQSDEALFWFQQDEFARSLQAVSG